MNDAEMPDAGPAADPLLRLAEALFRAGRPFEILPLPGLTHMVPDPVVMERQWRRTADFFGKNLAR